MSRPSRRRRLLTELRDHVRHGQPWGLTFAPCGHLTNEQRQHLERHLGYHFRLWADTWVYPWIDEIEARWLGMPEQPDAAAKAEKKAEAAQTRLVGALEAARTLLGTMGGVPPDEDTVERVLMQIEDAIAYARGQQS